MKKHDPQRECLQGDHIHVGILVLQSYRAIHHVIQNSRHSISNERKMPYVHLHELQVY